MADLGKTQAQWDRVGEEFALFLVGLRYLEEVKRRFSKERIQLVNLNDFNSNFSAGTLSGVVYGTGTNEDGILYVRVTGGPTYTISLYTSTGASGLVAQGTATAGNTATLAEQNSSGVTGTITLSGSVTTETDDVHQIRVDLDFIRRARGVLDGSIEDDIRSLDVFLGACNSVVAAMEQGKSAMRAAALVWAIGDQNNPKGRLQDFLSSGETDFATDTRKQDGSGAVRRLTKGLLPTMKLAMADETTGGTQDIIQRALSGSAGTFDSRNDGLGAVASFTPQEHSPLGRATFTCIRGVDTGNLGAETFSMSFSETSTERTFTATGLRVGQSFSLPDGGGTITLTRTLTKTGDGSNDYFVAASNAVVSGENNNNTNSGVLYWQLDANASNWNISFFKSSARLPTDLVAKVENVASGASFTATPKEGSGLSVVWQLGGTESDGVQGTLLLNPFKVENSSGIADSFYVDITASSTGIAQELIAREFEYHLNSDTSGSESISDGSLAGAGVGFDYLNRDT